MQQQRGKGIKIALTGANGFLASHITKKLLEKGYQVVGTVRDPQDTKKVGHLLSLHNASTNLKLVKASFSDKNNTFIEAFKGCNSVIHTATLLGQTEDVIVNQNLDATKMILEAIKANNSTIKSVAYTSGAASVFSQPFSADKVYNKDSWPNIEEAKKQQQWYPVSKALMEKLVTDFQKQNPAITISSINPTIMQGPPLSDAFSFSQQSFLLNPIQKAELPGQLFTLGLYQFVDVRDVADLHINTIEKNVNGGRFLSCGEYFTPKQYIDTILKLCKEYSIKTDLKPIENDKNMDGMFAFKFDTKETEQLLGKPFTSLEQSLRDNIEGLKKLGNI